jgi:parallel beta-helix repeat protein
MFELHICRVERRKMDGRSVSGIMVVMLLIAMLTLAFNVEPVRAEPTTWIVDDDGSADFHTIQEAINAANEGDTIFVRNGIYYEHVVVNKTVSLIGENRDTTIIDGEYTDPYPIVDVAANNVRISSFTIQHSRDAGNAIWVNGYVSNVISDNIIASNAWGDGIRIHISSGNVISNNIVTNSSATAIGFDWAYNNTVYNNTIINNYIGIGADNPSYNNTFSENTIINNSYGLLVSIYDSKFFHNNIINNDVQASFYSPSYINTWNNSCEGNYWSNYDGSDLDGDGVGDTPFVINSNNIDYYPLMNPYWNPADINHDMKVNVRDVFATARAFGSDPSHVNWNCHVDIVVDGTVNVRDIFLVAKNFGKIGFQHIEFQTISIGWWSGYVDPAYFVIENQSLWETVWSQTFSDHTPKPPLPEIDFSNTTVIAVFMGEFGTSGYEIEIQEIADMPKCVVVDLEKTYPGYGCILYQVMTQPYHIVKIPKVDKEITFDTAEKVIHCL